MVSEDFVHDFEQYIHEYDLSPEQIFNADESAVLWKYIPRNTYATSNDEDSGFKENKQRLTLMACSNASGTCKIKMSLIGYAKKPRYFPYNVRTLPVNWYYNKKAWMTQPVFLDWYNQHFIPEARAHCTSVGLDEHCEIVLLLDNCTAHPPAEELDKNNVFVKYLPPNCTSIIQPQDQGIIRSLKCKYPI